MQKRSKHVRVIRADLYSKTRRSLRWLKYLLVFQSSLGLKKDAASTQGSHHLTMVISPKKLALVFTLVVLSLILAHVGVQYLKFFQGHNYLLGFERQLNLDNENNLPTWYSSSALLLSAILLAVIGLANKREGNPYANQWLVLAAIFLYLSLDEAASLHEMAGRLLKPMLQAAGYFHGFLYFTWVVFGAIFVLIVALAYLRFLAALPAKTRYLFLIAGTLYVGGALGIEILGARYTYFYGAENFTYTMFVTVEEGFEMLGVVVFLYALLSHLGSSLSSVRILVNNEQSAHTPAIAVEITRPQVIAQTEMAPALGVSQMSARRTTSR
jgi:hypothetical protein